MSRKRTFFGDSSRNNRYTYTQYMERLIDLSVSMFDWVNVPDTIDTRFLELTLFHDGQAVFFKDEELGFLCLQSAINGRFNVYRIPVRRRAYAVNGYQRDLTDKDSVLIWNNLIHSNSVVEVRNFAQRLYNLDRIIDVNVNAQKTPVMIQATEQQRLTLLNLYKAYDGNAPFIFGDKNLDLSGIKAISTGAPYLADKLYELKTEIWNEALTYLGISNVNIRKKERLITDEVNRLQGGTIASRYSRLQARRQACEEINRMFDLDIWVNYREDFEPESNIDPDPLEVTGEDE